MDNQEIKQEIKKFIVSTTEDDHQATNDKLESIIAAKVQNRYDAERAKLETETD